MKEEMIDKRSWKEFLDSGLLWWINMILHTFGWSIAVEIEDNKPVAAYPVRTKFRGFIESKNTEGYIKVTDYLKNNVNKLYDECAVNINDKSGTNIN